MLPAPAPTPVPTRFLVGLGLLSLLLASGFLLLIWGAASYEQVAALGQLTYHEGGYKHFALALTPGRYQLLRGGLAAVAALSGSLLLVLGYWWGAGLRLELRGLALEIRRAAVALAATARGLPKPERWVGTGLLAGLLAVRGWYFVAYPLSTDEVASYDYFVRPGPLAISCFYPIPNNHPLFNFSCWPLALLTDNVRLVMRLPTLLVATVGSGLGYLLLIRTTDFRVATLATGLFSFSPLGLYYAVAGRGYFLQLTLLLLVFFGVVALLQSPAYRRLGWLAFVGGSVLGFYTIPTFAYPFGALGTGLLLGLAGQRRWPELGQLLLMGGVVGAVVGLLYAPIVGVSGLQQLVGNHYVAPVAAAAFWPKYAGYVRFVASDLTGTERLGQLAAAGGLLLGPVLGWRLPRVARTVGGLAWLLLAVPLLLMAGQQVFVPGRVLLFFVCFGNVLGGLVALPLLTRLRVPGRYQLLLSLLVVAAYGGYQFRAQLPPHRGDARADAQMQAAYAWLTGWGGQRVLLAAPTYELFFHHYAQQQRRPLLLHSSPVPGQTYDFAIQSRGEAPLPAWVAPPRYAPVYENEAVIIYGRQAK